MLKQSVHSIVTNIISIAISFIYTIVIARCLGAEGKGYYDILMTITLLITTFLGLSLPSGIIYTVASQSKKSKKIVLLLFGCLILQITVLSIFTFILPLLGIDVIFSWLLPSFFFTSTPINKNLLLILIISLSGVTLFNSYLQAILIGEQHNIKVNNLNLISKILAIFVFLLTYIFSLIYSQNLHPIIYIITYFITLIFTMYLFYKEVHVLYKNEEFYHTNYRNILSALLNYSLPCYLGNLLQFLNYKLDIFILSTHTENLSEIGIYTLSVSLIQLVWIVPSALNLVMLPKLAALKESSSNQTQVKNIMETSIRSIVFFVFLFSILIAFTVPKVTPIIYGKTFSTEQISQLFWGLTPGIISIGSTMILSNYMAGMGVRGVRFNAMIAAISCMATILFNLFLIPKLGILGAAISSSISYLITGILTFFVAWKYFDLKFGDILNPWMLKKDIQMVYKLIKTHA